MSRPDGKSALDVALAALLDEDPLDAATLMSRLDSLSAETGGQASSSLLAALTQLSFAEPEARMHLQAILLDHEDLCGSLRRPVGLRVAALDYFLNHERRLIQPSLIERDNLDSDEVDEAGDPLSGLMTASRFRSEVHAYLRRAERYGHPLSVLLMDLDDFSDLNVTFGAEVGDAVIAEASGLLVRASRDIDVRARPGEDEFALLLSRTGRDGALRVGERFLGQMRRTFDGWSRDGRPVPVSVSIGLASFPEDASDASALLARAAEALYERKATGKNGITCYSSERRRSLRFAVAPTSVDLELLGAESSSCCRPKNVSQGGMLLDTDRPLEVGRSIEMRVTAQTAAPGSPGTIVRGRVVRLEPRVSKSSMSPNEPPDGYDVGVAFDDDLAGRTGDPLESVRRNRNSDSESKL